MYEKNRSIRNDIDISFLLSAGCTAHSEPDKKAVESSSTNAVIDTTQVEELSEKAEGRNS